MDDLIVIVGGSGFIGRYLVQELVKTERRIRVVTRDPQTALFLKPLGGLGQIQPVAGNIRDAGAMARAFEGASSGVNLVGILGESGTQRFHAVQAEGAAHVAAAAAAAGVASFVQMSAIGADPGSPSAYGRSKAQGEAAVRKALPHATVLRPSLVFGADDGFTNRFAGMASSLPVIPVAAGGTRFQPAYVLDIARAAAAALADPARYGGQVYTLGGPRTYALRELIAWIAREIRADKPVIELPDAAAAAMARIGSFVPGAPLTWDQWLMLQRDNVVPEGAAGFADFGIDPVPLEAVAPAWLVRYRSGGRFHRDAA